MVKIITAKEATALVKDGDSLMIGGFMSCGAALTLLATLVDQGTKNLTCMCNDASHVDRGIGRLVVAGQIKHLITTHIGLNPVAGQKMHSGEMEITLVPQGTLAERIRAGGAGLGGFLTPTGVGTVVQEGKQVITIEGKDYLLELPIRAKFAFIKAHTADKAGNLVYHGSTRNFNETMATAADIVIAEVENIVEIGQIDPNHVVTPGVFIDYLVKSQGV